jgi:hypothetical protein
MSNHLGPLEPFDENTSIDMKEARKLITGRNGAPKRIE